MPLAAFSERISQIKIERLRELCRDSDNIEITRHTLLRFWERKIMLNDVISAIQNGEIIEHYPNDYPFPSCLVFGLTVKNTKLHTVCGVSDNKLWIITAYFPTLDVWEKDFKTRKAVR